jgi:hypothetical protein
MLHRAWIGRKRSKSSAHDATRFVVASIAAHAALYGALRCRSPNSYLVDRVLLVPFEMQFVPLRRSAPSIEPRSPSIALVAVPRQANRAPAQRVASASERVTDEAPAPIVDAPGAPRATAAVNPARTSLSGMRLLESVERDAWTHRGQHTFSTNAQPRADEPGGRTLADNVARVRDDWREQVLRGAPPPRPAGSSDFVRRYVAEAARAWRPTLASEPSVVDGVLRLLTSGVAGYREAMTDMLGGFGSDRGAAASDALDHAHPNSPMLQPTPTLNQTGRALARRISAELEVAQAPDGSIISVRVARSSGTRWFDSQADAAVRTAVASATAGAGRTEGAPRGAGTRSRWEFELRIARNLPVALGPQLPGSPPVFNYLSGGVEWGGVDPPRAMYPFALHRYQRIRVLWIVPDGAQREQRRDAGAAPAAP